MSVRVRQHGEYELFETTNGHRILVLDGKQWYAWIHGQEGQILVHSDSDHEKDHGCQDGKYYLVDFADDPKFKDMPHLFLQDGSHYQEMMVPNGLPTEKDYQKKVVVTDDTIGRRTLEQYLRKPAPSGAGEDRRARSNNSDDADKLPIKNYESLTVEEVADKLDELDDDAVSQVLDDERQHKNRKTVREAAQGRLS